MDRRLELHNVFKGMFGTGKPNVYYQPPKDERINYPCIIYKLDDIPVLHANNAPYALGRRYQVTVIDRDPESPLWKSVAALPTCRLKTPPYAKDNLHHFVFTLFY